jgi:hypothetical protein
MHRNQYVAQNQQKQGATIASAAYFFALAQ